MERAKLTEAKCPTCPNVYPVYNGAQAKRIRTRGCRPCLSRRAEAIAAARKRQVPMAP